jgi:hypothetical protein
MTSFCGSGEETSEQMWDVHLYQFCTVELTSIRFSGSIC